MTETPPGSSLVPAGSSRIQAGTSSIPAGAVGRGGTAGACPVTPVVDLVFSRWTTPILWTLHHQGRMRFTELRDVIGTVTAKVLTQCLRRVERDGLITRHHHAAIPPRVEYEITTLGSSLGPIFAALATWSADHLDEVDAARHRFDAAKRPLALPATTSIDRNWPGPASGSMPKRQQPRRRMTLS